MMCISFISVGGIPPVCVTCCGGCASASPQPACFSAYGRRRIQTSSMAIYAGPWAPIFMQPACVRPCELAWPRRIRRPGRRCGSSPRCRKRASEAGGQTSLREAVRTCLAEARAWRPAVCYRGRCARPHSRAGSHRPTHRQAVRSRSLVGVVPFDYGLDRGTGRRFKPLRTRSGCRSETPPGCFEVVVVEVTATSGTKISVSAAHVIPSGVWNAPQSEMRMGGRQQLPRGERPKTRLLCERDRVTLWGGRRDRQLRRCI